MIDIEQLRKLSPKDGDIFVVPDGTSSELAWDLAEALHVAVPGIKALVVCCDIHKIDVADMNRLGWYRA
jgi:hypothetical protein